MIRKQPNFSRQEAIQLQIDHVDGSQVASMYSTACTLLMLLGLEFSQPYKCNMSFVYKKVYSPLLIWTPILPKNSVLIREVGPLVSR